MARYATRSRVAVLVIAAAISFATILIFGCVASTLAMLARCGENMPAAGQDGCRWLEYEDGWVYLPLYASILPAVGCVLAYWTRSALLVPVATALALVIAVPAPFLIAS